jgi:phosphoenolpyruvate carboxykinase (GTP)
MGSDALALIEKVDGKGVVPCYHSLGAPLKDGQMDVPWPCNETKRIVHFPEDLSIWSFGSGYGGNALLGKKCLALRIASVMARKEGWLAEHMLILSLTSPSGRTYHVAAAFPSACGKTNLAMLRPSLPGWKVSTIGDDIAWMKVGSDGRLYAINPEAGFFGVAPGTSDATNPAAMATIRSKTIFTNVALTDNGDVWWEGLGPAPAHLIDWKGKDWMPGSSEPAAHPNSRFCVGIENCPIKSPNWNSPKGVPIDAILFGGRRTTTVPLVVEVSFFCCEFIVCSKKKSFSWNHGTLLGASIASEQTAAAEGTIGLLRHDPFAMLPFAGYNMADYFAHWMSVGQKNKGNKLPRMFQVNWFRKSKNGKFLWPGFGDNIRVLKWVCQRLEGAAAGKLTPIGFVPTEESLDLKGLTISSDAIDQLLSVNAKESLSDVAATRTFFKQFGNKMPPLLMKELDELEKRLENEL